MESFIIEGGHRLKGEIEPTGNRNSALALLAASLLTQCPVVVHNMPEVGDVHAKMQLLQSLGIQIEHQDEHTWQINSRDIDSSNLDSKLAQQIPSSILLIAPLIRRNGSVILPKESGDLSLRRRMVLHFDTIKQFGVRVEETPSSYVLRADRIRGSTLWLREMGVTATEQAIMMAVMAEGTTTITNAASEPHVQDLCLFLNAIGGKISGIGSNVLRIDGVTSLRGGTYTLGPDYVEVGSLIALAAVTDSKLCIKNARPRDHRITRAVFGRLGIVWAEDENDIMVASGQDLKVTDSVNAVLPKIDSEPWPGFTTDLISTTVVAATQSEGTIAISEKMYGNRLFFVDRLIDMGADIIICDPNRVVVTGKSRLRGLDPITSPDVRAGLAMIIAALCAEGDSRIYNIGQIDRAFERIDERLAGIGARIHRE